jgi:ankyrin repeat protein
MGKDGISKVKNTKPFIIPLLLLSLFSCKNSGYKLYSDVNLHPTSRRGSIASKQTIEGLLYEIWESGFIRKNELTQQEILNNAYGIFRRAPKAMSDPDGRAIYQRRAGTKDLLLLSSRLFGHLEPAPKPPQLDNVRVKRLDKRIRATLVHELFHDFWHNLLDKRKKLLFSRETELFFMELLLAKTEKEKRQFLRNLGSVQLDDMAFDSFAVLLEILGLYRIEKWGPELFATLAGRAYSGKTIIPESLRKYYSFLISDSVLYRNRILDPSRAELKEKIQTGLYTDNLEELKLSLEENPALVSRVDRNGFVPLHHATYANNLDAIQLLIESGADITAKESNCAWTPLLLATHIGQMEIVQWLIDQGAGINRKDAKGRSLIHIAAQRGQEELMEMFLRHGGEIQAKDDAGMTPLHLAAFNGRHNAVSFLISRGASTTSKDFAGQTPLHLAAFAGAKKSIERLIAQGVDIDQRDNREETALHIAVLCGNEKSVELLIAAGADRDIQNIRGENPEALASKAGYEKIAEMLRADY